MLVEGDLLDWCSKVWDGLLTSNKCLSLKGTIVLPCVFLLRGINKVVLYKPLYILLFFSNVPLK